MATDISTRIESEQRIRALLREINHRVKNQFAVILSMVRETTKRISDPEELQERIRSRIMALARSQDLLVSTDWRGAELAVVVKVHLGAFGRPDRVALSGPKLTLNPNAVQNIGMALHELGTNSVKYGALRSDAGTIRIAWRQLVKPYISAGPDGTIQRVNGTLSRWLGIESEGLVGKRVHDLLTMPGKIYYETHFAPLLRMQGHFNEVALDLVRADGSRLPALVNAVERRTDAGETLFVRLTIFDATDRRRYEQELMSARQAADRANEQLKALNAAQEQKIAEEVADRMAVEESLRQAQKMEAVGQLTGGIAHDFNNMLAVVISGLNLIQRRVSQGNTDIGDLAAAALEGATRAATLTQRLLAFSRQQPLAPEPLGANTMVAEMSELLRRTLGEQIHMETVLASGLWRSVADRNQLENAIINLAVNARDAMPEGGRLTIETANAAIDDAYAAENQTVAGQYIMIAVTDTGSGMDPSVMQRAFDPFFTTKGVGRGTGLGLSQVFGFVKQSNGHIKIYSEVGVGTTIKIYLPRYYGTAEAPNRTQLGGTPTGTLAETVLVVEDDAKVRTLTEQMLRELGYGVLGAERSIGIACASQPSRGAAAPNRCGHAGHEWPTARRAGAAAPARPQDHLHDRLHPQCHRTQWHARC